jgi:amidase
VTDIAFSSAKRLAALIRSGKIGCLELLDHFLARVERHNPELNAIVVTDIPKARRRAREADRTRARGEFWGPLHGVPMTVKDSFDMAGLPTTWGSPDYRANVAATDSLAVKRWRAAGAIPFGKTNVPIWLADLQAFNDIYGRTKNPWNTALTPGGSSGGSTAALAAGLTGIEMGSDIAGSIRAPATLCGVFGHKPTFGICPPHGHALDGNKAPLDMLVVGPLGRSADDLALGLAAMAGPDEIEATGLRLALPRPRKKKLHEYKVGVICDHPTAPVTRELGDMIQRLVEFLAKRKVKVSTTARPAIDLDHAHRTFDVLLRSATSARQTDAELAANVAARHALDPADDGKRARRLRGLTLAHRDWLRLDETRQRMRWAWHEFFKEYDFLLCPETCSLAFPHTSVPPYERDLIIDGATHPFMNHVFWAGYSGMAYLPATAAPIGFTPGGIPAGIQIVGPQYGDFGCIGFARLLEREYQGFVPPPNYV